MSGGPGEQLLGLRAEILLLRAAAAELSPADLERPVPACPDFTVRALLQHVGWIERWVVAAIRENRPDDTIPEGPPGRAELVAWLAEGGDALLDVLAATSPDTPCWHFGPRPRTAGFWFRRQLHEHTVHRVDLALTLDGGLPPDVAPSVALDGIDEVATVFFPRQVRLGRAAPLAGAVALVPTEDVAARRVLAGDGLGTDHAGPADAEVHGPAEALYLLAWRRTSLADPRLSTTGDEATARTTLACPLTP